MRKLSNRCQSLSADGKDKVLIKSRRARCWMRGEGYETMRNFPVLLVALGGLTAFVIPAAAESNRGSCAPSPTASDTIDLQAIPMMSATGPKSVKGVGDDECDGGKSVSDTRASPQDEELGDSDD
ncbi:hypothetical protein DPM33_12145 [Mesorhizobium hawassense]|uniref:Uncharacterized protein n=1 Tax=Mesorhizobium hawassense TaxID=1209954 RepID=A0A330HTC6_9HYPH|nr:hypothetical protein [Mesorhizobium hawassense]RAZ91020.1 hypothetical protein DPM33_12145 [Mesorhizobium hawassense]